MPVTEFIAADFRARIIPAAAIAARFAPRPAPPRPRMTFLRRLIAEFDALILASFFRRPVHV